ncbi:60S ribosomal protein L11 [Capsicum baccatum]|uniref:60S ribosomal protein L11 n=1 Tax=Capsicum baccatum TaxID=33114 RepID=A0A2G2XTF6_CAPBA|nr:60S ribosomal protein L11 [Capsicum baccatum]
MKLLESGLIVKEYELLRTNFSETGCFGFGELENVVESCRFNEVDKLIGLSKSIKEGSEEVDKPKESKYNDNEINMKLEKLEEEIRKIKEKEKNWRRIAEGRTRDNTHFFVVFFCCILVKALSYLVGMLSMKNDSMGLP